MNEYPSEQPPPPTGTEYPVTYSQPYAQYPQQMPPQYPPPQPYAQQPYPQPAMPQYPPQQPQMPYAQQGYASYPQQSMPGYPPQQINVMVNNVNSAYAGLVAPMRPPQTSMAVRMIYFVCIGWWLGMFWLGMALVFCCTIIGMPIGIMMLNRLPAVLTLKS